MLRFAGGLTVAMGLLVLGLMCTPAARAEPISAENLATPGAGEQPKEVTEAINKFRNRDFDGAVSLLETAAKNHPDLPPAQVIMAQLFAAANQAAGVRMALEKAVLSNPDDPEAFVILGDFALRERRVAEASLLFDKAALLATKFDKSKKRKDALQARIDSGLAAIAEIREDWPAAQKDLENWLKLDPKNSTAMQRLARALFQQKRAVDALQMLQNAAKNDPQVLTPEATLARFYEQFGDRENAKKWMSNALKAAPKDLKTRLVAAQWALETSQFDEAQKQASEAMRLDSKSLDAKILRGVVALFQKDYKAAEFYFESAHLNSPSNFAASNNLALALIEQPEDAKKKRAREYAEANARQYPRVAEAASTYGWVLFKLGMIDEAEQALRTAASSGNLSADTAYYIARVAKERGRKDEAKQLLQSALKTNAPFSQREDAKKLLESMK